MEKKEILGKCDFYELINGSLSICVYNGDNCTKSFVLILVGTEFFTLENEKTVRTIIANLSSHDISLDAIRVKKVTSANVSYELKNALFEYCKKRDHEE